MRHRLSRWLTTLVELRLPFFSTLLWIGSLWFLISGIAILVHNGLSNWNTAPYFALGAFFLVVALRRFVYNWKNTEWRHGRVVRLISIMLVAIITFLGGYTLSQAAQKEAGGEFANILDGQTFSFISWQRRIWFEDFAETATFWSRPTRLNPTEERVLVLVYFDALSTEKQLERQYDREGLTPDEQKSLEMWREYRQDLESRVERILSRQVGEVFRELDLNNSWLERKTQAVEAMVRGFTKSPWALEPFAFVLKSDFRFERRQPILTVAERGSLTRYMDTVTLDPGLTPEERDAIEAEITEKGFSAYIVGIGGRSSALGPNMVLPSGSLQNTIRIIVHERLHISVALYPLSLERAHESRIIEETAVSIMDNIIGDTVYCRFYDDPTVCEPQEEGPETEASPDPDWFDYRAAMRETYLTAEAMLAQGDIDGAEAYMEERRVWMCEQGYCERVINQAFFAFNGVYANNPAREDAFCRLGVKIQKLWEQSESLRDFLVAIRELTSREALEIVLYGEVDATCST